MLANLPSLVKPRQQGLSVHTASNFGWFSTLSSIQDNDKAGIVQNTVFGIYCEDAVCRIKEECSDRCIGQGPILY